MKIVALLLASLIAAATSVVPANATSSAPVPPVATIGQNSGVSVLLDNLFASKEVTVTLSGEDYIVLPKGSPLFEVRSWYPFTLPNNAGTIMRSIRHTGLTYQECLINSYCDITKPVRYTTANIMIKPTFDYDAYLYFENRMAQITQVDGKVQIIPFRVYGLSYIDCVISPTCHPFLRHISGKVD